jgi:hypothetical protein
MNSKDLKKIVLLSILFFLQGRVSSQDMYVGANTYVYASNQYIYIKNDLELNATTSNFYLRNNGQLIQGTTGSGANKGVGILSVFQEGSVNNYQYNYWCSPVGNASTSTATNNPFGIAQLGVPTTTTATTMATILSSNIYDGTASPFAIASYWVYKFINNSSYSDWVQVGSNQTINAGEGFTMKGSLGTNTTTVDGVQNNPDGKHQRYDFRGKPNDGTIDIPVLVGELTLTGNPYPSAIDLTEFLNQELNCTGTAYFWEQDKTVNSHNIADYKGGYAAFSGGNIYIPAVFYSYDGSGNEITSISSPGNIYERKYAPIGQGFMIEGMSNGNVQMKNSYRIFVKEGVSNLSQFEKRSDNNKKTNGATNLIPQIRFNTLIDNGPISQMVLAFDPLSTDGFDRAKDASSPNDGPANNFFVINNDEYVINVLPFDIDKKIPIGFRNYAQANYKITVNTMTNIPELTNVYLHDKTTDLYYDIKNSLYDLTLPAGTYSDRYEITFKNGASTVDDLEGKSFVVEQNNVDKFLTIKNPLQLNIITCSLYDVVGKLIFSKTELGTHSSYSFPTSNLSNGIYIVKLSTNDKIEMGQKIIIKN